MSMTISGCHNIDQKHKSDFIIIIFQVLLLVSSYIQRNSLKNTLDSTKSFSSLVLYHLPSIFQSLYTLYI